MPWSIAAIAQIILQCGNAFTRGTVGSYRSEHYRFSSPVLSASGFAILRGWFAWGSRAGRSFIKHACPPNPSPPNGHWNTRSRLHCHSQHRIARNEPPPHRHSQQSAEQTDHFPLRLQIQIKAVRMCHNAEGSPCGPKNTRRVLFSPIASLPPDHPPPTPNHFYFLACSLHSQGPTSAARASVSPRTRNGWIRGDGGGNLSVAFSWSLLASVDLGKKRTWLHRVSPRGSIPKPPTRQSRTCSHRRCRPRRLLEETGSAKQRVAGALVTSNPCKSADNA